MNILTFDTTFQKTYITLTMDNNVVDSIIKESEENKYHSAFLLSGIADILRKNDLKMQNIDKIATNIGPGSFTGIRVCTAVAKIISQQMNIDVLGFSSLEILSKLNKTDKTSIVVLDARREHFYTGMFTNEGENLLPLKIYPKEKMLEYSTQKDNYIICDKFSKKFFEEYNLTVLCFEEEPIDLGICLAELAIKKSTTGDGQKQWFKLEPLYIQPPPITLSKNKKQVS